VNLVRRHKIGGLEVATRRSADAVVIAMRDRHKAAVRADGAKILVGRDFGR
jgi:hypothetical protein